MSACSSCSAASSCSSANQENGCSTSAVPQFFSLAEGSSISTVIAVGSGKGGVGKSTVTSLLAVMLAKKGYSVGILDADVTGPSMAQAFGLTIPIRGNEFGQFLPARTILDIKVVSLNLLLPNPEDPVVWRGPVISTVIRQFWTDTVWGKLDVLLIDMPPGTGDVPLTIFQNFPVDRYAVVTTPQDLVSLIVGKACKMAEMLNVEILGLIENMAYFEDPETKKIFYPFGKQRGEGLAKQINAPYLDALPINPSITKSIDEGKIEMLKDDFLMTTTQKIIDIVERKKRIRERMAKN